ncbi:MAG: NeuD/PglB/VioB family sugar acetyltransferase [Candidatus Shapirobacteria bacterium]|nr:NeuD/PglB/VioB family sugar acetyltransferase [Candidatus Shapirobacteria bacterium]MDD3002704.1 NeuD/PglB/VioB family sugar acetyltransferase [Candidatus Shapirobacteria bacterium]MDD4383217.1 NeuD/PglB/VioB family sugar acetyltransferase [Candidatus Shapirobacteria bacterium]
MKSKIIIIGGGGHAKVLISIIKKLKSFETLGYTDIENKGEILGVKYLGTDSVLEKIIIKYPKCSAVIGVGRTNIEDKRQSIKQKLIDLNFSLPVIISPTSTINEDVTIGKGTVIFDRSIVNSGARIGETVILNTNSVLEHDCFLENNVFIGPNSTICGGVFIDQNSFIGAGSTIIPNIKISKNCLIGAGSVIINNLKKPGTYVGIPGKLIKL